MTSAVADWRAGFWPAAASALVGALAGAALGDLHTAVASAFLAAAMGAMAVEDIRSMRVPDAWNLPAALGGFAAVASEAAGAGASVMVALGHGLFSAVLCGGVFLLLREVYFRWRGVEGLGFGDVKLAATGGVWLGWEVFPAVVMLAAAGAIVWIVAISIAQRGWGRNRRIPFGTFLAPAIWFCWVFVRIPAG